MGRFVLRFRGKGAKPPEDVARISASPNTTVLDDSPRMLLVEAPEAELKAVMDTLSDWVMTEERRIPLPDPRPKLRQKAEKEE